MENNGQGAQVPAKRTEQEQIAAIASATQFSEAEIAVLKNTIVPRNVSTTELSYFLMVAKQQGLSPFNREIWCIKGNDGRLLIMTARDGFLKKAQADPRFAGIASAAVRANDDFELDLPGGKLRHVIAKSINDRGQIIGAYCMVRRKDTPHPHIEWAAWETFNKGGRGPWASHPDLMIQKVAESHAIKKAFGFAGLDVAEDYEVRGDVAHAARNATLEVEAWGTLVPAHFELAKKEIEEGRATAEDVIENSRLDPDGEQAAELRRVEVKTAA